MQRLFNRSVQLTLDLSVLAIALVVAFVLRFEGALPPGFWTRLFVALPYVVALQYTLLLTCGVTRIAWRYFSLPDLGRVVGAIAAAMLVLAGARAAVHALDVAHSAAKIGLIPYGIILMDAVLAFLGITGIRVARRMIAERSESSSRRTKTLVEPQRTILIGAGRAGALVAKEIAGRPDLGIAAVGFLDDDPVKSGTVVHGIKVVGTTDDLGKMCAAHGARQALVTIAGASGTAIRRIKSLCDDAGVSVKIIPGMYEIVGGQVNMSRIRDVAIEDLLRRAPVQLDQDDVERVIHDRVVLVTGAGGSIGSEICRQLCRLAPTKLVLVEQAENPLFHIERELRGRFPDLDLVPCIADICDEARVDAIFAQYTPDVVFHAAAHKHVPLMEANPGEAVKNNVFGTKVLADAADRHKAREFVMISTDKAVNPTSVMGVSKRVAEIYVQSLSQRSETVFVAVRFGNVLGSAGSVVPIFQDQIARGGPITITHSDMQRYFMTIPEATQLVLQAASLGEGGEIFILDMGEPVRIYDLARDLIALSGLREGEDIEIVVTGLRPGEKLFEEISTAEEAADKTRHPKVLVGRITPHAMDHVLGELARLQSATESGDAERIRRAFAVLVPEYHRPVSPTAPPPGRAARHTSSSNTSLLNETQEA
jgi:FlaA1/EpsC-like NDP-sugar epimerase